jgi:hypothetical protein
MRLGSWRNRPAALAIVVSGLSADLSHAANDLHSAASRYRWMRQFERTSWCHVGSLLEAQAQARVQAVMAVLRRCCDVVAVRNRCACVRACLSPLCVRGRAWSPAGPCVSSSRRASRHSYVCCGDVFGRRVCMHCVHPADSDTPRRYEHMRRHRQHAARAHLRPTSLVGRAPG